MAGRAFLAWDLGAESGRAIAGVPAGGRLALHELHRFGHAPVRLPSGLYWDVAAIHREILAGTRRAAAWAREENVELVSLGVDTWGVDFGLLDAGGELLGLPMAYRDPRHEEGRSAVLERIGNERLYSLTGLQLLPFNSLFQLYALQARSRERVAAARRLLMMPDLLHFFLCGEQVNEYTIASTSHMLDAKGRTWADGLLDELGIRRAMLGTVVQAGTRLGPLLPHVQAETGAQLDVVAPPGHDTAAAVAAVPARAGTRWAYLSSGTWSLFGAECAEPVLSPAAAEIGFTNEGGVDGTIRFLKNIAGLWLVQECRRAWEREGTAYSYDELTALAEREAPLVTLVDPDDPRFLVPGGMPERIADYARETGQPAPETPGQMVRTCLSSLALVYRRRLEQLESVLGERIEVLHIVGGGARNGLLNQMTADATGRTVVAGPFEATALGNLLVQAQAAGEVGGLSELREIAGRVAPLSTYEPKPGGGWDEAAARLDALRGA